VAVVAIFARNFVLDAAVVQAKSMLPRYRNGEVVLIVKANYGLRSNSGGYILRWASPIKGDVVAAIQPSTHEIIIKRIGEIRGDKTAPQYFLVGDNSLESIDSRDFGLVPLSSLIGKVIPQR
jgi:signal peptidase I